MLIPLVLPFLLVVQMPDAGGGGSPLSPGGGGFPLSSDDGCPWPAPSSFSSFGLSNKQCMITPPTEHGSQILETQALRHGNDDDVKSAVMMKSSTDAHAAKITKLATELGLASFVAQ